MPALSGSSSSGRAGLQRMQCGGASSLARHATVNKMCYIRLSSIKHSNARPRPAAAAPVGPAVPGRGHGIVRNNRAAFIIASAQGQGATSTPSQKETPPPPLDVDVKFIAIGTRGAAALEKLVAKGAIPNAEMWCLDVDPKVLELVPFANGQLVPKDFSSGTDVLSPDDVLEIVGRTASDAGGRGNIGSADGGVAFVLAPAAAGPGGGGLVIQLTRALRAAGHFTVAAVTAPFDFEGSAKKEQARALVAELEVQAHLVAVMEQDVLLQAFGDSQLTVAEATDIADTALEHTARSVLQAVQAQEILKSSRGALMWHGRDLRHYKRLLSPPLQQLLTCPGTAVLGRGLATLPSHAARRMGGAKALMHLASDAVLAASESPFLDGVLDSASAVLCCVNLPPKNQAFVQEDGSLEVLSAVQTSEGERHATRMAAQAAAGALRSITGRSCDDFVLCVEPRPEHEALGDGTVLQVEATLLVLRLPVDGGTLPEPSPTATLRTALPLVGQTPTAPILEDSNNKKGPNGRLPSSSWSMLSAMAGGGKSDRGQNVGPPPQAVSSSTPPSPENRTAVRTMPFFQGETAQKKESASDSSAKRGQEEVEVQKGRVTVGDYLADSLTAQSLDLPPAAAKWRQGQRADQVKKRRLIVWEVDETEPWEEEEEEPKGIAGLLRRGGKQPKRQVNLRERVAGMLAQDRDDAWD